MTTPKEKLDILAIEVMPRGGYLIREVSTIEGEPVVSRPIAAVGTWGELQSALSKLLK